MAPMARSGTASSMVVVALNVARGTAGMESTFIFKVCMRVEWNASGGDQYVPKSNAAPLELPKPDDEGAGSKVTMRLGGA